MESADSIQNSNNIKIEAPSSILIIGPENNREEHIAKIVDKLNPDWADVRRLTPDESKNKSNNISISQIREAQSFINLTPVGKSKILIIENATNLAGPAANSILKTLEEPPKYAVIILGSNNDNLLPTIISRCQIIKLWNGDAVSSEEYDFEKILNDPFYMQSQLIELLVSENKAMNFLADFESWARNRLRVERSNRDAQLIKEIINAKRDIKHNVNSRAVLESIILRYISNV